MRCRRLLNPIFGFRNGSAVADNRTCVFEGTSPRSRVQIAQALQSGGVEPAGARDSDTHPLSSLGEAAVFEVHEVEEFAVTWPKAIQKRAKLLRVARRLLVFEPLLQEQLRIGAGHRNGIV
jgi:hypothetical protein